MASLRYFCVDPADVQFRPDLPQDAHVIIRGEDHHHLSHVLRMTPGQPIRATNGLGEMFSCSISEISAHQTIAKVHERIVDYGEASFRLTLAVAVPKISRFEWLLEKATELGVYAFQPVITQRSAPGSAKLNTGRLQKILKAAMKQCGRSRLPGLHAPQPLAALLAGAHAFPHRWIAHRAAQDRTTSRPAVGKEQRGGVAYGGCGIVLVGPEGGFAEEECHAAADAGFAFIDLGERRLRTETAALVAATLLLQVTSPTAFSP